MWASVSSLGWQTSTQPAGALANNAVHANRVWCARERSIAMAVYREDLARQTAAAIQRADCLRQDALALSHGPQNVVDRAAIALG